MNDPTSASRTCTLQTRQGAYCEAPAMDDLGLLICGYHARQIFSHFAKTIAEFEPSPVLRRVAQRITGDGAEANPFREGTIYYLLIDGRVKIGWTGDLRTRLQSYPPGVTVLATEPGTLEDEQERLARFALAHDCERTSRACRPTLRQADPLRHVGRSPCPMDWQKAPA